METPSSAVKQLEEVQVYENLIITAPWKTDPEEQDGITVYGPDHAKGRAKRTIIRNCIIDFRNIPAKDQDEAISGVCGAKVTVEDTVIIGSIKAFLCGNGDYAEVDKEQGEWTLRNVVMLGCGRRCPEAQDGVKLTMTNCLIENWGEAFDVRAFGAWAHRGASIKAYECLFVQKHTLMPSVYLFFKDLFNHIGEAWNDRPSPLRDYLIPGTMRGAVQSTGGSIELERCYASSPHTVLQGSKDPCPDEHCAYTILDKINKALQRNPLFYTEVFARCRDSVLFRGFK